MLLKLNNLSELTSLHINDSWFRAPISIQNCFKLNKLFYYNPRALNYFNSFENVFFNDIEELYVLAKNSRYDGASSDLDFSYDFSDAKKLKKIIQPMYSNGYGWYDRVKFGFSIKNGMNLSNDLTIKLLIREENTLVTQDDLHFFNMCLDDNITNEFLMNNISIESPFGSFNGTAVTTNCD